jgi:hypothetical protein
MNDTPPGVSAVASPPGAAAWPLRVATGVYFVAIVLLHLQFSIWLVSPREGLPWGRQSLAGFIAPLAALAGVVLAIVVVRQWRRCPWRHVLAAGWALVVLAAVAIDRWLTFSLNEVFHYPQYAALAWLVARTLDPRRERCIPGRVLFWTTLLGAADELAQYLWITTSYSHYADVNDVVVNFVAGAAGVLLYYGGAPAVPQHAPARRRPPTVEIGTALVLAMLAAAGLATGRLQPVPAAEVPPGGMATDNSGRRLLALQRAPGWHGSWQEGPRRGRYYVMRPAEGLAALAFASVAVAGLGRAAQRRQRASGADAAATMPASSAPKSR